MDETGKVEHAERKVLAKVISYRNYIGIGLGSIIGIGWVLVAGEWLVKGGPLGAMLAFFIGGLLLATVGKCYAELTSAFPVAGGEIAFAYRAFGTGTAFLTGWLLAFGYTTLCPFETVALGWLFERLAPSLQTAPLYSVGGYDVSLSSILPGILIGLFIIILNYRGVKNTARFQMFTMILMFACVIVFTIVAIVKGSFSHMQPLFSGDGSARAAAGSVIAVLGLVPWFMSGFDTIPQAAEESGSKVQPKNLGTAIIVSILAGVGFYCVVIFALSTCMPWRSAAALELPTADVFSAAFEYGWVTTLVLIAAFFGLITSLNGFFLASCRVIFAAGRGGLLPRWFGEVDERYHTPKNAIIFSGIIALAGPFIGRSSLLPIVTVGSLAFVCAWGITCICSIRLRKTLPGLHRPYKVKHTFTLYLGTGISVLLILLMIVPGSSAQMQWPHEYGILAVWMLLGYAGFRRRTRSKDMSENERSYQILGEYNQETA